MSEKFVPVKIHIKERPQDFGRFKAEWTPTLILMEPDATERYRFEGYLPVDDFLAQLRFGLAKAAFSRSQFLEAESAYRSLAGEYPKCEIAPEAIYWAGVSAYKADGNAEHLTKTGQELRAKYPQSDWTKKSSVWIH